MFISHADFIFSLKYLYYLFKLFFIWSFQSGAANPDGIIRLFMRMPMLIVYYLFGSLAASYFLIVATLLVCYGGFYYFLSEVVQVKSRIAKIISSLFFVFNPVFLGNTSKLGLVQGVGMLPLSLVFLYKAFERQNLFWFLPWIVAVNASLIHPFTFVVNLAINFIFFVFLLVRHKQFFMRSLPKFFLIGVLALALHAYAILPLMSMGSLDKSTLTQVLGDEKPDYTSLIRISSSKNVVESASLAKSVFVDFEFYNSEYQSVYLFAIFLLYALMIAAFFVLKKKMATWDKRLFLISLLFFLCLILASTTSTPGIEQIISSLVNLPAGWMFRSPLKWQLYMPIALFSVLALVLKHMKHKKLQFAVSILYTLLIAMNAYVMADVYKKLLTPRSISQASVVAALAMDEKNLLFISDSACAKTSNANQQFFTELQVILASKNVQVKKVNLEESSNYLLSTFDYVLTCSVDTPNFANRIQDKFAEVVTYLDGGVRVYQNKSAYPLVYATDSLYAIEHSKALESQETFVESYLDKKFVFSVGGDELKIAATGLKSAFSTLKYEQLSVGKITDTRAFNSDNLVHFFPTESDLKLELVNDSVMLTKSTDASEAARVDQLQIQGSAYTSLIYFDDEFEPTNLIPNGSFESGAWNRQVGDCYNYDDRPQIEMATSTTSVLDGKQSLEFRATRHLACTDITIPVDENTRYLFTVAYQGSPAQVASYYLEFNDTDRTGLDDVEPISDSNWQVHNTLLTSPAGASELNVTLYGHPLSPGKESITRYDAVGIYKIPNIEQSVYAVQTDPLPKSLPHQVASKQLNPTKTVIDVHGATDSFYLITKDSYHQKWELRTAHDRSLMSNHFVANNFQNGWLLTAAEVCRETENCVQNEDGTYDFRLVLEFEPQRWFYVGFIISLIALEGCVLYVAWVTIRSLRSKSGASKP